MKVNKGKELKDQVIKGKELNEKQERNRIE